MFSKIRKSLGRAKRIYTDLVMQHDTYVKIRRYHATIIDELTGDPQDVTGNSFTDYKFPCVVGEMDDYKSRRDKEWTGEMFKGLRVVLSQCNFKIIESDIAIVDFNGDWNPYRILSIKTINGRIQLDVERIDRAIS